MALTLLLAVLTTTAWALDQDPDDGYYLISSAQDRLDFANGINDGTIAAATNVKLMADITATTMIGSFSGNFNTSKLYSGIFDGNHHTIAANINNSSANYVALISCIRNATIMDLTVTGSISGGQHCSGLVSVADGTNTISNVSISATITGSNSHCAGVLGHSYSSVTTINDCIFTGTINGRSSGSTIGVFNGWSNSTGVSINNCVEAGTYTNNSNFNPIAFSGLISYSHNSFITPAKNSNYVYGTQMSTSIPDNDVYGQLTIAGNTYYIPTVVSGIGEIYELIDDPITLEPIVTYIGNFLTKGTDYTVSYSNNDAVGIATVTITGAGEFSGEKNINFIIYSSDYALIGTAEQLKNFATLVNSGVTNAKGKLIADIDLAGDDDNQWTPIGTDANKYNGTFDGQGFTIKNLYYKQQVEGVGLFGFANSGAYIKNVRVEGTVDNSTNGAGAGNGGTQTCAGGIIGKSYEATVLNCSFSGNVISYSNVGGLVGWGTATIVNCYNEGTVMFHSTANQTGGGVHGYGGSPQLKSCYNVGSVINNGSASFAIGSLSVSGSVSNSYSRSGCVQNGSGASWINAGITGTVMSLEDMKSEAFVTTLNTNIASLRTTYPDISEWTQDPITNQPVLKIFSSLTQDENGYYLLGSVQDWKNFAELVNTTPTANAKMTADIDLGDDQTMLGSFATPYAGIFDGQGHTLTIHYNTSGMTIESGQGYLGAAPFRDINGATIRNLHTAGTVTADKIGATGMVGWAYGACVIERCCVSVNITATAGDTFSGFVFRQDGTSLQINDCIFNGSIMPSEKHDHGGFVGHAYNGQTTVDNCLMLANCNFNGTSCYVFVRTVGNHNGTFTINNSYYQTFNGTPQGTQATIQQLADGTTATYLQADRTEEIWVQDPVTNQPMLALFANTISFNGDGSEDNPFIITTTAELDYLAFLVNGVTSFYGKYFKLGNDIEYNPNVLTIDNNGDGVNDSNYTPIGNGFYIGNNGSYPFEIYSFQGHFDGDGHTISGIRIYRDGNTDDDKFQGIFGFLSGYSRDDSFNTCVCNLTVTDTDITGFRNIGGVFGENDERVTIENCHVANNVVLHVIQPGSQCIGGIAGFNFGNVAHCSSAVTITVTSNASNDFNTNQFGGLVGANHGILANNLVIGATIPIANTYNTYYGTAGEKYGAILGWATDFSITRHNYYSACTVAGVPNATNVGCGDTFGAHDLNDNNGAVPGNVRTVAAPNVWISEDPENESIDGWAFIASPLTDDTDPESTSVENIFSATDYDLYRLNPSNTKWENWKVGDGNNAASGFSLENGRGYLYATQETDTIKFNGEADEFNLSDTTEVALSQGFNLVGNPFPRAAYINKPYYTLNADGSAVSTSTSTAYIPPCYGVVVDANEGETVTFTTTAPAQQNAVNNGNLQIAVSQVPELVEWPARDKGGVSTGSTTAALDNAIVSFNEGERLGKFYFGSQNANIYLPQNGKDYAIAYSDGHGEMPINVRANENGQYTITVNPENVEMAYLHLIDNMTGADVDLLQTPEYTFNAKVTDYESRFKLVFVAKDIDGPSTGSGTFAFIDASGNIIITADASDASLQVIDAMGRVLVCRDARRASAISTTGMAPGVYVLRLISGDNVRTQKIVVR